MEKVCKVYIGEVVVEEEYYDASILNADIEEAAYWSIRNNVTVVRFPHVVDIYVYGTEYLISSEQYVHMSNESIAIAVASTLVNFVEISNV